jgi:hypothetical protein
MKTILWLVLALAFSAGIFTTRANAEGDDLIVPGMRVGSVHLGMSELALYKELGGPSQVASAPGYISYVYPKAGLYVYIDSLSHQIFEIDVAQSPNFHTIDGITIGSRVESLKTEPPEANDNRPPMPGGIKRNDYSRGMTVVFSAQGTVLKISVWSPGGAHF